MLSFKWGQVAVLLRMCGECCGKVACELRDVGKRSDTSRNGHVARLNRPAIGQFDAKLLSITHQRLDIGGINLRRGLFLKPATIVEEKGEWDWLLFV